MMDNAEIAEELSTQKARWKVKKNPKRVLTDAELSVRCGFKPDLRAMAALRQQPDVPLESVAPGFTASDAATRPRVVDWRNYNGRNAVTPVKDQGQCGSCVAFAVAAVLESRVRMEHGFTANLSEADLFYCGGRLCADGWWPGPALSRAQNVGVPLERSFPYVDTNTPCTQVWDRALMSVFAGGQVSYLNAESRKNYLANVGPMVGCFDVFQDFNAYGSGVYHHVTGNFRGGHCVEIIGYDDNQSCWICKNSWGSWWGDNGFFRIGYGECGIDSEGFLGIGGNPFFGTSQVALGAELKPRDFTGKFASTTQSSILRYRPAQYSWELINVQAGALKVKEVSDTSGFGQVGDGRPFWTGDFTGDGKTDILFYFPGDMNWWLGAYDGTKLNWTLAGNTKGFGQVGDGRPIWTGDFTGDGKTDILFYFPGDMNWWLGAYDGTKLNWTLAGNTKGFGQVGDGRPFWTGDFTGDGKTDILFYYPGDMNWWLGQFNGTTLSWTLAGNTKGFGQIWDGRPFWTGRFTSPSRTDMLFYFPGDENWWLGTFNGTAMSWKLLTNTHGFGQVWDGRPFWIGDYTGDGLSDILFYFPGDRNWWLGHVSGGQLRWDHAGNTAGFGQVWDGRPFWTGDFSGDGKQDMMFFYPGDANWWLGSSQGTSLAWTRPGNTLEAPAWA